MRISGTTFMNVVAPDITVLPTSADPADGEKRGDDIRQLTATERGGVFRFGLYLTGFGQPRNVPHPTLDLRNEFVGQNSDLVIAFKEETPNRMTLRLAGGDNVGPLGANRSYFIQIPAQ